MWAWEQTQRMPTRKAQVKRKREEKEKRGGRDGVYSLSWTHKVGRSGLRPFSDVSERR